MLMQIPPNEETIRRKQEVSLLPSRDQEKKQPAPIEVALPECRGGQGATERERKRETEADKERDKKT